jgi:hypothetical protein
MFEIADLRLIFHAEVCTYVTAYLRTTPHIPVHNSPELHGVIFIPTSQVLASRMQLLVIHEIEKHGSGMPCNGVMFLAFSSIMSSASKVERFIYVPGRTWDNETER